MNSISAAFDRPTTNRMRISFPARVMYLDSTWVLVDRDGRRQRASRILAPHLRTGDWVFVAAGSVIERLSPLEAERLVATLNREVVAKTSAAALLQASHAPTSAAERNQGRRPGLPLQSARPGHQTGWRQRRRQQRLQLR